MIKETILGPEFRELRNKSACAVVLPPAGDSTSGKPAASAEAATVVAPEGDAKDPAGSGNAQ